MLTVARARPYVDGAIGSLLKTAGDGCPPINVFVGNPDESHLAMWREDGRVIVHGMDQETWAKVQPCKGEARAAINAWRALSWAVEQGDAEGVLFVEDDTQFANGWFDALHREREAALARSAASAVALCVIFDLPLHRRTGSAVAVSDPRRFYGTQCIWLSPSAAAGVADDIKRRCVDKAPHIESAFDVVMAHSFFDRGVSLWAATRSWVQHAGDVSSLFPRPIRRAKNFVQEQSGLPSTGWPPKAR